MCAGVAVVAVVRNPLASGNDENLGELVQDGEVLGRFLAQRALELTWRFADSYNPQLLHTLGWAHYRTGNARAAVQFLERALEQGVTSDADDAILRYHLGMAYLAADNRLGARKQLELSLKLASEFPGAAEARAALWRLGV